jgi:hypothetical protein
MMIMGLAPAAIWFGISLAVAVFSLRWGGVLYVAGIYIAIVIFAVPSLCMRPPNDPTGTRQLLLSSDGERLFKKYYAFFKFPMGTQTFAHFINFARMFGIVWIAVCLWQRMYLITIANAAFYLISAPLMWRLSPIAHYNAAAEKGAAFAVRDLMTIQRILDCRDDLGF